MFSYIKGANYPLHYDIFNVVETLLVRLSSLLGSIIQHPRYNIGYSVIWNTNGILCLSYVLQLWVVGMVKQLQFGLLLILQLGVVGMVKQLQTGLLLNPLFFCSSLLQSIIFVMNR